MIDDLDKEETETLQEFGKLGYGPPTKGALPDGWKQLSELPEVPEKGTFYVEELSGGILLGKGWRRLEDPYSYDLLARQKAWEIANTGNPTRVLATHKRSLNKSDLYVHCAFYKKDNKVYISYRVDDDTVVEQEVDGPYDSSGFEMQVQKQRDEECSEALRNLGYKL